MRVLGVDIGGSGVRAGLVDEALQIEDVVRTSLTDRSVGSVVRAVRGALQRRDVDAVGVGMPGFVRSGVVLASPNFPTWCEVDLAGQLAQELGVPVAVENDANAAALGVHAARQGQDLVLLTLGTGVGGGVISEGRLLRGLAGTGAELGHIYVGGDRRCGCGGVGCLETWASTTGLVAAAHEIGQAVDDGLEVVTAARTGAVWATKILEEAGRRLGIGLVTLTNVFAPHRVVLAGGLSQASDLLAPPMLAWWRGHGIAANVALARVEWVGRADELAMVGAATAARRLLTEAS